jgi:cytochrome b561
METRSQYNIAKLLHWLIALIVVLMLMSGWRTSDFSLEDKEFIIMIHSGLGTAVFLLMSYRWWWRKSNNLYSPPGWQKRPSMLMQYLFYPLLLLQPVLGMLQAIFIDYKVVAFEMINYSAMAASDEEWFNIFHQAHAVTAGLLILIFLLHVGDKSRKFFLDDTASMQE